jgi:V8-like Glu-specific endopeptidase
MTGIRYKALLAGVVLTSVTAAFALAGERKGGDVGGAAASSSRAAAAVAQPRSGARAVPAVKFDPENAPRAAPSAEEAQKTYTLIGRTRSGREVRLAPSEDVVRAVLEGAGGRAVVGKDDRVRVKRTTDYPYSTIGYLEATDGNDNWYACTGVMIGAKAMLTSAACLYRHGYGDDSQEGWNDQFTFWPALNGQEDAPYGGLEYDTAYVFEGWVTEYDGSFDSVLPFDIGIITFADPIGESTGWMGYWDFGTDVQNFDGNLVGYHFDKTPEFTMWRSKCKVKNADIYEYVFVHDCDVGDSDVPLFVYDPNDEGYYVVGVHAATTGSGKKTRNLAVRLYGPVYDWISQLGQEIDNPPMDEPPADEPPADQPPSDETPPDDATPPPPGDGGEAPPEDGMPPEGGEKPGKPGQGG